MTAPTWKVWGAILGIAVVTFAIRFSFVYLMGRIERVPPRLENALGFVPAAVLAALSVPAFISLQPTATATLLHPQLLAGGAATVAAWKTEDVTATVVTGMAGLYALQYVGL